MIPSLKATKIDTGLFSAFSVGSNDNQDRRVSARAPSPYAIMLVAVGDKPNFNKFLKVNECQVSGLV